MSDAEKYTVQEMRDRAVEEFFDTLESEDIKLTKDWQEDTTIDRLIREKAENNIPSYNQTLFDLISQTHGGLYNFIGLYPVQDDFSGCDNLLDCSQRVVRDFLEQEIIKEIENRLEEEGEEEEDNE